MQTIVRQLHKTDIDLTSLGVEIHNVVKITFFHKLNEKLPARASGKMSSQ